MAAGKSTKAIALAAAENAVLLSEDKWLDQLYPDEISTFDDYISYSGRLKVVMQDHVKSLLQAGVSVVMDFPANTIKQRAWFKQVFEPLSVPHILHYIDASDERCLKQLTIRSAGLPAGVPFTSEEELLSINAYFQAPSVEEGFNIQYYSQE